MNPDSPVTPDRSDRLRRSGALLPLGLAAVFLLGAAGFFYAKRDAGPDTSPAPGSQQAARPADKEPASPPAETPARPSASVQQPEPPARSASPSETPAAPPAAPTPAAPAPSSSASSNPMAHFMR